MNNAPELENYNIKLRQAQIGDISDREKLGLNIECVLMCGGNISNSNKFSKEDAVKWYERIVQHPCKWVIEYNDNCIGAVALRPYIEDDKAKFSIEIYDSNLYGYGIGTNVTKMILKYAFESLKYHKVYLRVLDFNTRAIKCYEKCGFIKEGIDREGALINSTYCNDIYMGILKSNYTSLSYK